MFDSIHNHCIGSNCHNVKQTKLYCAQCQCDVDDAVMGSNVRLHRFCAGCFKVTKFNKVTERTIQCQSCKDYHELRFNPKRTV